MVRSIYEKWCVPFSFLCYTKHSVNLMTDIKYAWMKERRRENVSV